MSTDDEVVRVAMWSGPRNISTAMMRAWENRPDTVVVDEPLYAAYLARTGLDHPAREEVIVSQPSDLVDAVTALHDPLPDGKTVHYAKHMTHHLLPGDDLSWVPGFRNVLLIRDPAEVVASYVKSRETCEPLDIGLLQEADLFRTLARAGNRPPVVDAADFLADPEGYLRWLCDWLAIPFTARMLSWPAGPRASDGVWAPHWYAAVWASTGFEPYRPKEIRLSEDQARVARTCRAAYDLLREHRVRLS